MSRPRIAIPVPTSTDFEYNRASWPLYAAAVERSGGEAVEIRLGEAPAATARLIADCSGVLLPGSGADVNPRKYGQGPVEECAPADAEREAVDELLLQDAHNMGKPILGICFGTQMLNVWRGGTLVQDLMCMPVNHKAGRAVTVANVAVVAPESLLGKMVLNHSSKGWARFEKMEAAVWDLSPPTLFNDTASHRTVASLRLQVITQLPFSLSH